MRKSHSDFLVNSRLSAPRYSHGAFTLFKRVFTWLGHEKMQALFRDTRLRATPTQLFQGACA